MRQDAIPRQRAVHGAAVKHSPIRKLLQLGQSPWLAEMGRGMLTGGDLERMITDYGIRGVMTSPSMFETAITRTHDYDGDVATLARDGLAAAEIYETVAVRDVQHAADLLRPAFDAADGGDGFVTLDVSARMAEDAGEALAEAKRLWTRIGRANAMIGVPGTEEGITATRALVAEGVNVCVTQLFSVRRYNDVLSAYLEGLEAAAAAGRNLSGIASVACFPLGRIDAVVDERLDALAAVGDQRGRIAGALRGQAAVAVAQRAYTAFEELTASPRFRRLVDRGAHPQRPMWAGIGGAPGGDAGIRYVEALVGSRTVCAMSLETLRAFHEHGQPTRRLNGRGDADAAATLEQLGKIGASVDAEAPGLLSAGVEADARAYDALIEILEIARQSAVGGTEGHRRRRGSGRANRMSTER